MKLVFDRKINLVHKMHAVSRSLQQYLHTHANPIDCLPVCGPRRSACLSRFNPHDGFSQAHRKQIRKE